MITVSRTIEQVRVVDELVARFTHSIRMDWLLPGIPPTGKLVELPFVVIVQFEGHKRAHEHVYWDQASVLVQVGLLERTLPVRGGETAAQGLNPTQPMNELIHRALSKNGNASAERAFRPPKPCTGRTCLGRRSVARPRPRRFGAPGGFRRGCPIGCVLAGSSPFSCH